MEIIQGCEATAISRYNRMSPSKVRRIADQIRSRSVKESIMILEFMPYRSCKFSAMKLLYSKTFVIDLFIIHLNL